MQQRYSSCALKLERVATKTRYSICLNPKWLPNKFDGNCDSAAGVRAYYHLGLRNIQTVKHILVSSFGQIMASDGVIVAKSVKFVRVKCASTSHKCHFSCWPFCPLDGTALPTLFPIHFSFSSTLNHFDDGLLYLDKNIAHIHIVCLVVCRSVLISMMTASFSPIVFYTFISSL